MPSNFTHRILEGQLEVSRSVYVTSNVLPAKIIVAKPDKVIDAMWKYACSMSWGNLNEADFVLERSTSQVIPANKNDRLPLTLAEYREVHKHAPRWLQLAMDMSLIALQARAELCNLTDAQYRDGRLFIIRQKIHAKTDLAYLAISVDKDTVADFRCRSRADGLACPYWIRRRSQRQQARDAQNKTHPFYVKPEFLSKAFAKARKDSGLTWGGKPPSFHEIRGLGSRTYEALGYSDAEIQSLLGHVDKKTTDIYLSTGKIFDSDYKRVDAALTLEQIWSAG